MIETDPFFRVRNDKLEIFLPGISHTFTNMLQGNVGFTTERRIKYLCDTIINYCNDNNINLYDTDIVFDSRMENFFISYFTARVIKKLNLDKTRIKVYVSVDPRHALSEYDHEVDLLADVNSCYFYEQLLEKNIDWENIEIDDKHVLSLAGRPTEVRAMFAKSMLDLCKDRIRISMGNHSLFPMTDIHRQKIESLLFPYDYPVNIDTDNKILGSTVTHPNVPGEKLFHSLLHVVTETNDFYNENIQLSEKSYKPFAWHQIPIFISTIGQVETVRSFGFDMFDDIIDHSYDSASNFNIYKLKILNTIAKFLKRYPTTESMNELRREIYPRLKANNELMYKLYKNNTFEPWPYYG